MRTSAPNSERANHLEPRFKLYSIIIFLIFVVVFVDADFPLDSPCLQSCANEDISATILQKCIDLCKPLGHCCGNRLNGEAPDSSAMRLSCANGCEMAFYRSTVAQCKADCAAANSANECEYNHPNIQKPFQSCGVCQEGCDKWPDVDACSDGCELAATLPEFYQYVEQPEGLCDQDEVPRFLFAGQSNMEGWSDQALPGSFRKIIRILNMNKLSKSKRRNRIKNLLLQAAESELQACKNESRFLWQLRNHLKKKNLFNDHPFVTCSYTKPHESTSLDCERALSSTACGGSHDQYGPEFMFGHVFPKLNSPLQGQPISIAKVAVGGTTINKNWMKENKGNTDNYWYALVDAIKGSRGSIEAFVWFQGENDTFNAESRASYLDNLTSFISDVRQEIYYNAPSSKFSSPSDIPIVIVELGRWIWRIDTDIILAQRAYVENDPNAIIVETGAGDAPLEIMTGFYHHDAASQLVIGSRIADAMAEILNRKLKSSKST